MRCTKSTTPGEYNTRIVARRRQKQIEDLMAARLETPAESIDRVHEKLKNDCKFLMKRQMRELGRCFPSSCVRAKGNTTEQGIGNLVSVLRDRVVEAHHENLNLNVYPKRSQPLVLLCWCCAQDKCNRGRRIKEAWLTAGDSDDQTPIEACLQELEEAPKLTRQLSRKLRKFIRKKKETCIAI